MDIGYPQKTVSVPDSGLYYMWVYFAGDGIKDIYGYILVDNLEPDIALESIKLPQTEKIELGKTLTLTPTFTPENATNKIVEWTSSDESIATVDNAGNVTAKKIGSAIITATSEDGNRKSTCTITVVESLENDNQNGGSSGTTNSGNGNNQNGGSSGTTNTGGSNNQNNSNIGTTNSGTSGKTDSTTTTGSLPKTGVSIVLITSIFLLIGISILTYNKYKKFKGI